jgi:ketosteroid isomerase-like protein
MQRLALLVSVFLLLTLMLVAQKSTRAEEASGETGQESTGRALERLDRQWTDAEIRGDVDAIGRFLADDFIAVNPIGGVSEKQQFLADYRSGSLDIESERLDAYMIRVHGDTAVMVHTALIKGTYRGARIDGYNRSMHVWRKTPEGWLIAATQGTPIVLAR